MAKEGMETTRCACSPVVGTQFGEESERRPSIAIIEAVAAAESVAPTELESLHEYIDLDAVDQLFASDDAASNGCRSLRFSAVGWEVFVRGDGAIRVCDPDEQTEVAEVFEKPLTG